MQNCRVRSMEFENLELGPRGRDGAGWIRVGM